MAASRVFSQRGLAAFGAHGLSPARVRALVVVGASPGLRMVSMASQLGVSARAITSLVDTLEEEGLVVRSPDPMDRRATLLRLTPAGAEAVDRIKELQGGISDEIFSGLSGVEQEQLAALLRKFVGSPGGETS